MTDITASDLFFNHDHPRYEALFEGRKEQSRDDIRAAVIEDAADFLAEHDDLFPDVSPLMLTQDFLGTL